MEQNDHRVSGFQLRVCYHFFPHRSSLRPGLSCCHTHTGPDEGHFS